MKVIEYKDKKGILIAESKQSSVSINQTVVQCNTLPVAMFEDNVLCMLDSDDYKVIGEIDDRTE